eukprot:m.223822 g.223822  ORF g.223822 m.223822 type:complete len:97 (+) comp26352_c0_seq13:245-535(+)
MKTFLAANRQSLGLLKCCSHPKRNEELPRMSATKHFQPTTALTIGCTFILTPDSNLHKKQKKEMNRLPTWISNNQLFFFFFFYYYYYLLFFVFSKS